MDVRGLHTLHWLAFSLGQTPNGPKSAEKKSFPQLAPWRPWVREKLAPKVGQLLKEPEVQMLGVSHHWVYPPENEQMSPSKGPFQKECLHLPTTNFQGRCSFSGVYFWTPSLQTAKVPENGPKPKRKVFQPSVCRDYVSFREGIPPPTSGKWRLTVFPSWKSNNPCGWIFGVLKVYKTQPSFASRVGESGHKKSFTKLNCVKSYDLDLPPTR